MGTGYYPGLMRPEPSAEHPPLSNAEVWMGCISSPPPPHCLHRHIKGWHLPFTHIVILSVYWWWWWFRHISDQWCVCTTTETIVFVEGKQRYVSALLQNDIMVGLHHWHWEKGAKVKFRLQYLWQQLAHFFFFLRKVAVIIQWNATAHYLALKSEITINV
jgi:hypothetical protein